MTHIGRCHAPSIQRPCRRQQPGFRHWCARSQLAGYRPCAPPLGRRRHPHRLIGSMTHRSISRFPASRRDQMDKPGVGDYRLAQLRLVICIDRRTMPGATDLFPVFHARGRQAFMPAYRHVAHAGRDRAMRMEVLAPDRIRPLLHARGTANRRALAALTVQCICGRRRQTIHEGILIKAVLRQTSRPHRGGAIKAAFRGARSCSRYRGRPRTRGTGPAAVIVGAHPAPAKTG